MPSPYGHELSCTSQLARLRIKVTTSLTQRLQSQVRCPISQQRLQQLAVCQHCHTLLQGKLDALEQRMLSKMDRALAQFLAQQLGEAPAGTTQLPGM